MPVRFASLVHSRFYKPKYWHFLVARACSGSGAIKEAEKSNVKDKDEVDYKIFTVSTKIHRRLPKRAPLVKNFFVGDVDKEFLAHPEVISRDDINKIYNDTKFSEAYFQETLNTSEIDQTRTVSENVIDEMRQLGAFGLTIPQHLGGKGYLVSESLLASEPETGSMGISSILLSHRTVCDIINEYGTEEQKRKYLPRLANGTLIASDAIYESGAIENDFFDTTAQFDRVDKAWIIKGRKSFVTNGKKANFFLVMAQNRDTDESGEKFDSVGIYLVDASQAGVKKDASQMMIGCYGNETCSIHFDNVKVSAENVVGNSGNMSSIIASLFKLNRLRTGLITAAKMKQISTDLADHCINTKQAGVHLKDTELVSTRLSKIACDTYAIESMTYYTAGLLDEFDQQDTDLESGILKIFCLERLLKAATSAMNFMGADVLVSGNNVERHIRDAIQLHAHGESLDNLRLYIGLAGLQHAGVKIHEVVKKERNPLFNPGHVFRNLFDTRKVDNPKLTLNLSHDVHPSLEAAAQWLEQSILRLQMGTEIVMSRHGSDIVNKQIDVLRLSECATLIYAMFASISRASRSYCIGIKNADYELLMSSVICNEGMVCVRDHIKSIVEGPFITNDKNHIKIAKQIYKSHGYFCDHPTKYNY